MTATHHNRCFKCIAATAHAVREPSLEPKKSSRPDDVWHSGIMLHFGVEMEQHGYNHNEFCHGLYVIGSVSMGGILVRGFIAHQLSARNK